MPSAKRASERVDASVASVGWFLLVVLGAGVAWAVCLPVESADVWSPPAPGDVFHLEWFIAAVALAVPIWYTARFSWLLGITAVLITSAQVLAIANEAASRLQQASVLPAITDLLYIAAALEVVVFVSVAVSGILRNLADRRCARLVAQLAALDEPSRKQH
jgi:hypothetical protein